MSEQLPVSGTIADAIRENAQMAIYIGIALLILGTLSVAAPMVAGVSITLMVGILITIAGVGKAALAFQTGAFGRGLMMLLIGLLMIFVGVNMMVRPLGGLISLTIILYVYLVVAGIFETLLAFQLKPAEGWQWSLANGLITLLLGLLLWQQFPLSGSWAIGVLFGIKLIMSGWVLFFVGRRLKESPDG